MNTREIIIDESMPALGNPSHYRFFIYAIYNQLDGWEWWLKTL
jgi:hypothetical protein